MPTKMGGPEVFRQILQRIAQMLTGRCAAAVASGRLTDRRGRMQGRCSGRLGRRPFGPARGWLARLAAGVALIACACTHVRSGPVEQHYVDFATRAPHGNTVYVCHAYGCRLQTPFGFTEADI